MFGRVIVDIASSQVDKVFDYIIPDDCLVSRGYRVLVPFGNRFIEGIVTQVCDTTDVISHKLKPILKPLENYK